MRGSEVDGNEVPVAPTTLDAHSAQSEEHHFDNQSDEVKEAAAEAFTPAPSALDDVPMPAQRPLFDTSENVGAAAREIAPPETDAPQPVAAQLAEHTYHDVAAQEPGSHHTEPQASDAAPQPMPSWMHNEAHTPSQISVASAPMQVEQLQGVLAEVGLELVQTNAEKLAQARANIPPPLPHVPRERRISPPVASDPLVQVETRKG